MSDQQAKIERQKAFDCGVRAAQTGKPITQNPYLPSTRPDVLTINDLLCTDWMDGYLHASPPQLPTTQA